MKIATAKRRCVLYGRTSHDQSEGRSVDDQLAKQREWATGADRIIVAEHRDDGISASRYNRSRKERSGWQNAMDLIAGGHVDELSVWEISRSTRDRPVWAALIAACTESSVNLVVDGKVHDPTDPDDGFMLDLGAAFAFREVAMLSKRVQRAVDSRAAQGLPHGMVTYGYRRLVDPDTGTPSRVEHPKQAPVVREIVDRLLEREPAERIARDLNDRGIPNPTGRKWRGGNLSVLALRPTYAGFRVYRGEVLPDVKAAWDPLITESEHYRLRALYADSGRDKFRNPKTIKYLGTGIYRCGREECGGPMRTIKDDRRGQIRYTCRSCAKVSRYVAPVDAFVEEAMIRYLSRPDVLELFAAPEDSTVREAAAEVARLRLKLEDVRRRVEADELSLDDLSYFRKRWEPKLREAEQRARPQAAPPELAEVAGPHARERWPLLPVTARRSLVAALLSVRILPVGSNQVVFDSAGLDVRWRTS